jgi:tRNA-2-methylthio-N6-dimethylallyladenosine synthase
MGDDVPEEVKTRRLQQIIELQQRHSLELNNLLVGSTERVLVEGFSKKSDKFYAGRTDTNKVAIFPVIDGISAGDYVDVKIDRVTSATLFGDVVSVFQKYQAAAV